MWWAALAAAAAKGMDIWGDVYKTNRQQQWQEYMASSAYQRSMADMQAAGLNPILAGQRGPVSWGGASGGGGGESFGSSFRAFKEQEALLEAEAERTKQQSVAAKWDQMRAHEEYWTAAAERKHAWETVWERIQKDNQEFSAARAGARIEEKLDKGPEGETSRLIQRYTGSNPLGAAASALQSMRPRGFERQDRGRGLQGPRRPMR